MNNKKIVIIDGAYPINVRNIKIANTLKLLDNVSISVISWKRDDRDLIKYLDCNEYTFSSNSAYGNVWKKISNLLPFFIFLKKKIKEIEPDFIIASHWDMLLLSTFIKGKNSKLIYENLDIPTSENLLL